MPSACLPGAYVGRLLRITETFTVAPETFYAGEEHWAYAYDPDARTYDLQERDGVPSVATVPEATLHGRVIPADE